MMSWQPQQQSLRELLVLLRDAADPNNREQALINQVKRKHFFDTFFCFKKNNHELKYRGYYRFIIIQIIMHILPTF